MLVQAGEAQAQAFQWGETPRLCFILCISTFYCIKLTCERPSHSFLECRELCLRTFLILCEICIHFRDGQRKRMMRKYADWCTYAEAIRKTKSVCAIVGKKNKVKNRTKLGRRRARAKTVKILNKNSQKSIKNRPKNGPKMVIFLLLWCGNAHIRASMRYDSVSPKTSTWLTLVLVLEMIGPICPHLFWLFAEGRISYPVWSPLCGSPWSRNLGPVIPES